MCSAIGDQVAPTFFNLIGDEEAADKARTDENPLGLSRDDPARYGNTSDIDQLDDNLEQPASLSNQKKMKRKRKSPNKQTLLTGARGVEGNNPSQVKTLLGS